MIAQECGVIRDFCNLMISKNHIQGRDISVRKGADPTLEGRQISSVPFVGAGDGVAAGVFEDQKTVGTEIFRDYGHGFLNTDRRVGFFKSCHNRIVGIGLIKEKVILVQVFFSCLCGKSGKTEAFQKSRKQPASAEMALPDVLPLDKQDIL